MKCAVTDIIGQSPLFYNEIFFISRSSDTGEIGNDIACSQPLSCVAVFLKGRLYTLFVRCKILFFYGFRRIRSDQNIAVYGTHDAASFGVSALRLCAHEGINGFNMSAGFFIENGVGA